VQNKWNGCWGWGKPQKATNPPTQWGKGDGIKRGGRLLKKKRRRGPEVREKKRKKYKFWLGMMQKGNQRKKGGKRNVVAQNQTTQATPRLSRLVRGFTKRGGWPRNKMGKIKMRHRKSGKPKKKGKGSMGKCYGSDRKGLCILDTAGGGKT